MEKTFDPTLARAAEQQRDAVWKGTMEVQRLHEVPQPLAVACKWGPSAVGCASAQGARAYMEDAWTARWFSDESLGIMGIFDGHGGAATATTARQEAPGILRRFLAALPPEEHNDPSRIKLAIKDAFDSGPESLAAALVGQRGGSTALVTALWHGRYYVANLGDSRAILVENTGVARRLSVDHKPDDPRERLKVERRGGVVTQAPFDVPRLNGILAMTRALGDWELPVGRRPQVTHFSAADAGNVALIMATDGIWDAISDQFAGDLVLAALLHRRSPERIALDLLRAAWKHGSNDNMTCMVLPLAPLF